MAAPTRSCPHLAEPHLANRIWLELVFQSVDRFWPNRIWPILVFQCFGQIFCCCLLFPVVACWFLLVLVGACWCLLVVDSCWCLLVPVGGACWCCCLCVWWVCSRFLGLSSRTLLRLTALPLDRPKFRSFFSLSPAGNVFLFVSLGGLLVELWPRFKAMAHPKCGFRLVSF